MNDIKTREKILLVLLPFWDPQIPPLGISCLKSFLQPHGLDVKTLDANVEIEFREMYDRYCDTLITYIPEKAKGNFYNVVHEVLGNHLLAHFNHKDEKEYVELIKILIEKTFFFTSEALQVHDLIDLIVEFYYRLENYLLDLLEQEKPSVLGLSVYGDTLAPSMFAFKLAKKHYPQLKTVMGGGIFAEPLAPGSSNLTAFLEKTPFIDKVIIGEGELLFLKWLQGEFPDSRRVLTIKDINGRYVDLTSVDIPDFSDLQLNYYPYISVYGSRSCPFQCNFCSETVIWGKYRKKSAAQLTAEMEKLYRKHNHQLFFMGDSLLNPIITNLANAFIEQEQSLYWDGFLRADKFAANIEQTMQWRRGGFYRARMGLESGSPRILEAMNKKITVELSKNALIGLARAGIKTTTFWVIGYPGETEEDFQMTLDFIEELKDEIYEADCNPFIYGLTGQVNSSEWAQYPQKRLYPKEAADMLIQETWIMECEPSREEVYRRVDRFIKHINKLGIANPYSLHHVYKADQRWVELHKNAVPPLVDFKNKGVYLEENKHVKELIEVKSIIPEDQDFCF
jgi:radical SAM superfamily enzyme YgiQ (UPF0313 family)